MHNNKFLQHAFEKYRVAFQFEILLLCDRSDLLRCEQHFIDTLKPRYNLCKIAGSVLGLKKTAASKRKSSLVMKKRIASDPAVMAKLTAMSKVFWSDPEERLRAECRQRAVAKVLWSDPKFKEKVRSSTKMSWTEERRNKHGAAVKDRWADPAHRAKILTSRSTIEVKEKLSAASKAMWAGPVGAKLLASRSTVAFKKQVAAASKARWADPIFRAKMLEARRGA